MTKLPSAEELDEELQTVGTQEKALELIHVYTIAVLEAAAEVADGRLLVECERHGSSKWCENYGCEDLRKIISAIRVLKEDL